MKGILPGAASSHPQPSLTAAGAPSSGALKWIVAGALFFIGMLNYADRTSITAVYALLKTGLGMSDVALGAVGSVFLWSYALASPFAGHIGDRFERRAVVLWSLAAWSLVTLLTGLIRAEWQLLALRALLGLVASLYLPAAMALVAEYHSAGTRATALAILSAGEYLGLVGGGSLAGYLGQHYGWRMPLCTLGVAGLMLAGVCRFVLPGRRREPRAAAPGGSPEPQLTLAEASRRLFRIPSFVVLAAAGVLTSIGAWIFINWLPLYFKETFAMSLAAAGFFGTSLVSLSAAASQLPGGLGSDWVARRGLHYRMLLQAVLLAAAAPTLLVFVSTHNRIAIMSALVLYSVFRSIADVNIIPLLCDLAGKDKLSTAFGITNMMNTVAGGCGVFAAGLLKTGHGLAVVFGALAGIVFADALIVAAAYAFFLKRDLRRAAAQAL